MDFLSNECSHCGSHNIEYITRVTGFFSKIGGWNKGKIAELRDRRTAIEANRNMFGGLQEEKITGKSQIKLFWKKGCIKCPEAKILSKTLLDKGYNIKEFDVETMEGLAESSMYMVMATPTFIITDSNEDEIKSWRGIIPDSNQIALSC